MDDAGINSAFDRIADEWDKAEKLIKTAEVTRNEVVVASVNELRYAGRRLVDALRAHEACRADPTCTKSQEDLKRYVSETLSFCQRALHDAVDAIILHVRTQIGEYEKEFGYVILADKFPDIIDIKKTLKDAEQLVILSREDRMRRAEEYDKLAVDAVPQLLAHCTGLEANRGLLQELVAEKRNAGRAAKWGEPKHWLGICAAAVLAFCLGIGSMMIKSAYEDARVAPPQGGKLATLTVAATPASPTVPR